MGGEGVVSCVCGDLVAEIRRGCWLLLRCDLVAEIW